MESSDCKLNWKEAEVYPSSRDDQGFTIAVGAQGPYFRRFVNMFVDMHDGVRGFEIKKLYNDMGVSFTVFTPAQATLLKSVVDDWVKETNVSLNNVLYRESENSRKALEAAEVRNRQALEIEELVRN